MSAGRTEPLPKGPVIAVAAVLAWYGWMLIDLAAQVIR